MDDDDLDDMLGPDPEAPKPAASKPAASKPRPAARRKTAKAAKTEAPAAPKQPAQVETVVVQRLSQPVSIGLVSEVMRRDRTWVTRRLANLPPLARHRGAQPLYDFRQAVQLLVEPKVDEKVIEDRLRNLSASDLPAGLQKDVWDARLKAQKWLLNAGELWPTEDVLEVLGEAFQRLKTTTQLWIDQVGDNHSLPAEARTELTALVDALQADLHKTLVEMPQEKATLSHAAALDEEQQK